MAGILPSTQRRVTMAACYAVYNEEDYLAYSIRSVYPMVDKIVICLGTTPWDAYNPRVRELFAERDRTEQIVDELAARDPKFVVIKGAWSSEIDQRQAAMRYCVEAGFEYYFLVDADEIYRADHLAAIREEVAAHPDVGSFLIRMCVLWRSFRYRIPPEGVKHTPWRIFKVTRHRHLLGIRWPYECRFIGPNRTNSLGPVHLIPPEKAVFYHFGYARTSARMRFKLATSEGRNQFVQGWFDRVWQAWPQDRSMTHLAQVDPPALSRAVAVVPDDLPEVVREHPYWNLEIIP